MNSPQPTGAYTDESGAVRCRATALRCLGHRQATDLVARARNRGELAEAKHCGLCSSWHYHLTGRLQGGRPRTPRRQIRAWKR